jgi:hypothetical protein
LFQHAGIRAEGEGAFRHSEELRDRSVKYALELGRIDTMIVGFESETEIDDFAARVRRVHRISASA